MGTKQVISKWHRRQQPLNLDEVAQFVQMIRRDCEPEPDTFPSMAWLRKASEIEAVEDDAEKIALATKYVDDLFFAFERQNRQDKKVRYTHWKKGSTSLFGDPIGVCPVCGRKGEIFAPSEEYEFAGSTNHVVSPFFMGQQTLDRCDWGKLQQ